MECKICGSEFDRGKSSRKCCYECLPIGLQRSGRVKAKRRATAKQIKKEKLLRGCDVCGYKKCSYALDWHHINDDKEVNPSELSSDIDKYREEVSKCILVCANCHREIHNPVEEE